MSTLGLYRGHEKKSHVKHVDHIYFGKTESQISCLALATVNGDSLQEAVLRNESQNGLSYFMNHRNICRESQN